MGEIPTNQEMAIPKLPTEVLFRFAITMVVKHPKLGSGTG